MSNVGSRIREERVRLGLTQDQLGVAGKTQSFYETGKSYPDALYLENFHKLGADVLYVVTGQRSDGVLPPDLQRVLAAWGAMPSTAQGVILQMLESFVAQSVQREDIPAPILPVDTSDKPENSVSIKPIPVAEEQEYIREKVPGGSVIRSAPKGTTRRKAG